jgi:hypothetical protein
VVETDQRTIFRAVCSVCSFWKDSFRVMEEVQNDRSVDRGAISQVDIRGILLTYLSGKDS